MASLTMGFETNHEDMIHDAQLDYYGKNLATASSDGLVKVFQVQGENHTHLADLSGHDGPVWQVSWAHPKYGKLLASCSYAKQVFIWKERSNSPNQWIKIYEDRSFEASVNSVSWAPHEFGLMLAAGCADGFITVYTFSESQQWEKLRFQAHSGGVNAVSWSPGVQSGAFAPNRPVSDPVRRFVSGGCDNQVRIWSLSPLNGWQEEKSIDNAAGHQDWVRDVAWAPSLGLPTNTIASGSEDKSVRIWTEEQSGGGAWKMSEVLTFPHKVWSVSWSVMGNILAVSRGDNKVSLFKQGLDGKYVNLSEIDEQGSKQPKPDGA